MLIITKSTIWLFVNRVLIVLATCAVLWGCQAQQPISTSVTDPKADYLQKRGQWVEQDQSMAFDAEVVLSAQEQKLNEKLVALRREMSEQYKSQHFFPPARYFFQSQQHIEHTQLFKLLRKMPKGGILHLHGAASGDAPWVIDQVINNQNAYVYWQPSNQQYTKGQIRFFANGKEPQGFRSGWQLAQEVPHFQDSLKSLLTFDERIDGDSVDIWGEFEMVFNRLYGFVSYQPMFKRYFYRAFQNLVDDGIQHVEIRGIFNQLYDLERSSGYYNRDSTVLYFQQIAEDMRQTVPDFTLKIIFTDLRFRSVAEINKKLAIAYQLRQRYPNFVIGFDLVAEEDAGYPTLHFLDTWMKMDSLQQVYGVDMPLYLHDGESDWVSVENLYDAVLLNSERIGHGFNLFRFPNLLEEIKARDICLEINPISNQILGFIRDLRLHPASTYLRRGVPCVISSDDPLIFNYKGLSYDFWEVFMAWELDLAALKQLALNSLTYSGLNENEKAVAIQQFHRKWDNFVNLALEDLTP